MDDEPAASISVMNSLNANYAVTAFLALSHPDQFTAWDYLRFNLLDGGTHPAVSEWRPECPLCGVHGLIGSGMPDEHRASDGDQDPASLAGQDSDSRQTNDEAMGDAPVDENLSDSPVDPGLMPPDTQA
jgi:hypothetical protein